MVLPLDSLQSACAGGLGRLLLSCWANVRVLRQRIRMEKMVARLIMEDLLCNSCLDATNLDYARCRRLATARVPHSSVARAELFRTSRPARPWLEAVETQRSVPLGKPPVSLQLPDLVAGVGAFVVFSDD